VRGGGFNETKPEKKMLNEITQTRRKGKDPYFVTVERMHVRAKNPKEVERENTTRSKKGKPTVGKKKGVYQERTGRDKGVEKGEKGVHRKKSSDRC